MNRSVSFLRANRSAFFFIVFLAALTVSVPSAPAQSSERRPSLLQSGPVDLSHPAKYRPDKLLVRFRPGVSRTAMDAAHAKSRATVLSEPAIVDKLQVVQLSTEISIEQGLRNYRSNGNVLYAEPDYLVHSSTLPNDPNFSSQWNLQNTGQSGGLAGADIHASQAWGLTSGSANVVVAVLDTGVDYTHQDLSANIWSATKLVRRSRRKWQRGSVHFR